MRRIEERTSPILPWLHRATTGCWRRSLPDRVVAYGTVGVIVMAGLAVLPFIGQSLFPQFKERDFLMHWITKPGTSVAEEWRIATQASREMRTIPGVRNFGSHIGQALLADEPYGVNFGENWISVDPAADYDTTLADIQEMVDGYPGLFRDVETYLNERIDEVLTGSSDAIVVRIYGPDLEGLHSKAEEVRAGPGGDRRARRFACGASKSRCPRCKSRWTWPRPNAMASNPAMSGGRQASLLSGEEVGDIFRDGKTYDVNVWSTPETRQQSDQYSQPADRHAAAAGTCGWGMWPTCASRRPPNVIYRENASRRIDVGGQRERT